MVFGMLDFGFGDERDTFAYASSPMVAVVIGELDFDFTVVTLQFFNELFDGHGLLLEGLIRLAVKPGAELDLEIHGPGNERHEPNRGRLITVSSVDISESG